MVPPATHRGLQQTSQRSARMAGGQVLHRLRKNTLHQVLGSDGRIGPRDASGGYQTVQGREEGSGSKNLSLP